MEGKWLKYGINLWWKENDVDNRVLLKSSTFNNLYDRLNQFECVGIFLT